VLIDSTASYLWRPITLWPIRSFDCISICNTK